MEAMTHMTTRIQTGITITTMTMFQTIQMASQMTPQSTETLMEMFHFACEKVLVCRQIFAMLVLLATGLVQL